MKRVQQGFTLIELMIVVAIIGILAAVAIPQYQQYTIKAHLGNAMTSVASVQTAMAECLQENGGVGTHCLGGDSVGGVPADTLFTATQEVSSIATGSLATGTTITATLQNIGTGINGNHLVFTSSDPAGGSAVTWAITSTDITNPTYLALITKNNLAS